MVVLACVLIELIWGGVGFLYGNSKGRPVLGFSLGLLLGVIGMLILAFVPERRTRPGSWAQRQKALIMCPWCLQRNPARARTCEHCLRPLVQPSLATTRR